MTVLERIAELQQEISDIGLMVSKERDAEFRNIAATLMKHLTERVLELKKLIH